MELSGAQRDAHIDAARSLRRSAAQNLDRNLLFQIFDYLRDGLAFLQCEATCTDYRSLLREESGIGQKLWQARPIAYGARLFATGGTAYAEDEEAHLHEPGQLEPYWVPGTVGWAERFSREIRDGGREVVLCFACMDAIGAAQRSDGASTTTLAGEKWTGLVRSFYGRMRIQGSDPFNSDEIWWTDSAGNVEITQGPHVRVVFSQELVSAATDIIEPWLLELIEGAVYCSIHRDDPWFSICKKDIVLAGRLSGDSSTWISSGPFGLGWALFDPGCFDSAWQQTGIEAALGAAAPRFIRALVRRAGGAAYTGEAHTHLLRLLMARLCLLLRRVVRVTYCRENVEDDARIVIRDRSGAFVSASRTHQVARQTPLVPTLEDLAYAAENGTGAVHPPTNDTYTQKVCDSDDGSFRSDDCPDTDDDDDSSIGDESVSSAAPTCLADRLASLASLHARGALSHAEFARAKALELGLP